MVQLTKDWQSNEYLLCTECNVSEKRIEHPISRSKYTRFHQIPTYLKFRHVLNTRAFERSLTGLQVFCNLCVFTHVPKESKGFFPLWRFFHVCVRMEKFKSL